MVLTVLGKRRFPSYNNRYIFHYTASSKRGLPHICAAQTMDSERPRVLWFRKGLRLHDNPALLATISDSSPFIPIFCMDPWYLNSSNTGPNRLNFLLQTVKNLGDNLRKVGSRLIVLKGDPRQCVPCAVKALSAKSLYYEKDIEPYSLLRDEEVNKALSGYDCEVQAFTSHTLWDADDLIKQNGGCAPQTMGSFTSLVRKQKPPPRPLEAPTSVPSLPKDISVLKEWLWEGNGNIPSVQELGIRLPNDGLGSPFQGGEDEALERLERYMSMKGGRWVRLFEKPKGNPASFDPFPATTVLSPYLTCGCLSCRLFYHEIKRVYAGGQHSEPPVSLLAQLYWREFFYTAGHDTPNHHQMEGNQLIRQIPWDDNDAFVKAWHDGQTGYPWIDAIMAQLKTWGWMHHLARHCVACFLTRGDLWCSWERGRDVFDRYLLDADHYINNGNWQWLSCSRFFYQYFRIYSPVTYGQKYDKNGDYVRHFLPVLKDFPAAYIYEPWTAPMDIQQRAGCIIGVDYPFPIVDHKDVTARNKAKMAQAYIDIKAAQEEEEVVIVQKQPKSKPKAMSKAKSANAALKVSGTRRKTTATDNQQKLLCFKESFR